MALIICEDCGREISDRAGSCPGCGCPISAQKATLSDNVQVYGVVKCRECGYSMPGDVEYCQNCGCKMGNTDYGIPQYNNQQTTSTLNDRSNNYDTYDDYEEKESVFSILSLVFLIITIIMTFVNPIFFIIVGIPTVICLIITHFQDDKKITCAKITQGIILSFIAIGALTSIFNENATKTRTTSVNTEKVSTKTVEEKTISKVKMPIIVGRQIEEVSDELTNLGLSFNVKYAKNEEYDEGLVLEGNIGIGELVDAETEIVITVNSFEVKKDEAIDNEELGSRARLTTGTYIIGEDIDSGKYNFYVLKGSGSIKIYNSYDDFKNDEYGYDAFQDFDLLATGASRGMLNGDVCTDTVMNIRLTDSQCLIIEDGVEIEYEFSEKTSSTILEVGVYVIGEDLDSGKYSLTAVKGSGSIKIYNSYADYQADEYGYDAFEDYDMKEANASVGLLNEDIYSQTVSNIRLDSGQCLIVYDGLKLEYTIN